MYSNKTVMASLNKKQINRKLSPKIVDARVAQVFNSFNNVLVTTSFGTTSAVLLHILSRVKPGYPVHFIDTGYHFEETLKYRDRLTRLLGLKIVTVKPDPSRHQTTQLKKLWNKNPDRCCKINKVEPLERVKSDYTVWMSGVLGYQSQYRQNLEIIVDKTGMLRCYPLIDWNKDLVDEYMGLYGLPRHPLEKEGFASIGCTHCTIPAESRSGRWVGTDKSECGLHR